MAVTIISPRFSFVQFGESNQVESCNFRDITMCLPVYEAGDIAFQFIIETDTEDEADTLCDITNDKISLGLVKSCGDDFLIEFEEKPERFRIGTRQVLYNWSEGFPDFDTVLEPDECFMVKVVVTVDDLENEFCSSCFQRISDPCHTSVIEYGSDENAFDFNYCNSEGSQIDADSCKPTFITFTNRSTLVVPYTASLLAKYGNLPTVQTWIYDPSGVLVDMGIRVAFNSYPPTELRFDFGGPGSGIIKIS